MINAVELANVIGWGAVIITVISVAVHMELQTRREIRELARWVKREKQMEERGGLGELKTREEMYKFMDEQGEE